jgi:validoxylamine A glucosyltransferase
MELEGYPDHGATPKVSVIIPTYNRAQLLHRNLQCLTEQHFSPAAFEVVVCDDGSSDETAEVVASFRDRLRLRYHFQPDLGFRLSAARNAGARLATAPVLALLDTGTLPCADFVREHLHAHRRGGRLALGYTYNFSDITKAPTLSDPAMRLSPQAILQRMERDDRFHDSRRYQYSGVDYDLDRLVVPWWICWGSNMSVRADDYWAAGGFDEDFQSWGSEDVEFSYRIHQLGVPITVCREAWSIELPHHREQQANHETSIINNDLMFSKHPEPFMEMCTFITTYDHLMEVEPACRTLLEWCDQVRDRAVTAELAAQSIAAPARVAVFGSGGAVPPAWASDGCAYTLLDFDADRLAAVARTGPYQTRHAIGLRSRLPDNDFDLVLMTSRMAGLWPQWHEALLAEAQRIGAEVRLTPVLEAEASHAEPA